MTQAAAADSIEEVPMEEEKDPEVLLEERRRKRAEIMAKFQAQGRKENAIDSAAVSPAPEAMGTGGDSVNSGGTRTGQCFASTCLSVQS